MNMLRDDHHHVGDLFEVNRKHEDTHTHNLLP